MTESSLERAIAVSEIAFHGYHLHEEKKDFQFLLTIASQALDLVMALIRRKLTKHEDAFSELHGRFFHFAHAALACKQLLGGKCSGQIMNRISGDIALYLLLERLDLFSMNRETQKSLIRALAPIMAECDVYFVPAGDAIDTVDGFWIDQEDKHAPGRSLLHGSLAGTASRDRLVTSIAPLIRQLESSSVKKDGIQTQTGMSSEVNQLIRMKIRAIKRKEKRTPLHEAGHTFFAWGDVVDLPRKKGGSVTMLEMDSSGFRLMVDDRNSVIPPVDSLIAVGHAGEQARRATLIWKRVEAKGVVFGGVWANDTYSQARLSMLGHSEMTMGLREWHALLRRIDDKHVACWIGEPELQPGISMLLPIDGKKYSATLDRVEHRGGNYCHGILQIQEEWREVNFELEI
jgi:hypothetical protein